MELELRPVTESDLTFLSRLTNDPDGAGPHQWYGWQDPHRYRRRWEENGLLDHDGGTLLVVGKDERIGENEPIGMVVWRKQGTSRVGHCWEIGLIVAPEFRGHGFGTRAQELLVRYLFDHSIANRIQAVTEFSNVAEQRALEKAGFAREGIMRGCGFRAGEWRDGLLYSILRKDVGPTEVGTG